MRSIFGLFTGLCIVSLCEVAYLRVIIIMYTSQNKTPRSWAAMVETTYSKPVDNKI